MPLYYIQWNLGVKLFPSVFVFLFKESNLQLKACDSISPQKNTKFSSNAGGEQKSLA